MTHGARCNPVRSARAAPIASPVPSQEAEDQALPALTLPSASGCPNSSPTQSDIIRRWSGAVHQSTALGSDLPSSSISVHPTSSGIVNANAAATHHVGSTSESPNAHFPSPSDAEDSAADSSLWGSSFSPCLNNTALAAGAAEAHRQHPDQEDESEQDAEGETDPRDEEEVGAIVGIKTGTGTGTETPNASGDFGQVGEAGVDQGIGLQSRSSDDCHRQFSFLNELGIPELNVLPLLPSSIRGSSIADVMAAPPEKEYSLEELNKLPALEQGDEPSVQLAQESLDQTEPPLVGLPDGKVFGAGPIPDVFREMPLESLFAYSHTLAILSAFGVYDGQAFMGYGDYDNETIPQLAKDGIETKGGSKPTIGIMDEVVDLSDKEGWSLLAQQLFVLLSLIRLYRNLKHYIGFNLDVFCPSKEIWLLLVSGIRSQPLDEDAARTLEEIKFITRSTGLNTVTQHGLMIHYCFGPNVQDSALACFKSQHATKVFEIAKLGLEARSERRIIKINKLEMVKASLLARNETLMETDKQLDAQISLLSAKVDGFKFRAELFPPPVHANQEVDRSYDEGFGRPPKRLRTD